MESMQDPAGSNKGPLRVCWCLRCHGTCVSLGFMVLTIQPGSLKKRIVCELCSEFVSVSSFQRNRRASFHLEPEDVTLRGDGNMSHSLSLTPEMKICSGCLIDWLVERS